MKIYVASSWRNLRHRTVVDYLRDAGHKVYDFRNPPSGDQGFSWAEIDLDWQKWDAKQLRDHLLHPIAQAGFKQDLRGMSLADACVLVLPCGRSAHLEAGYMAGQGKSVYVLLDDGEPELMYLLLTHRRILVTFAGLLEAISADEKWAKEISPAKGETE